MKVIVATTKGQGQRRNDFSHTNPGELVYIGFECDGEAVDGKCGCRRSWTGALSGKGTTTARIVDRPLNKQTVRMYYRDALARDLAHDVSEDGDLDEREELEALVDQHVDEMLRLAAFWHEGTVLERRGTTIKGRAILATTEVVA